MTIDTKLMDKLLKECKTTDEIIGKDGLLKQLTKALVERALEGEMSTHLGYNRYAPEGKNNGNSRNGRYKKNLKGEFGEIEISIPRDRNSEFEPIIVPKGQTRFDAFNDKIISM